MTDILSPLAYLCGKPTAKAKLKALPEHFQVNEVLGYSLTGLGEALDWCVFVKQGRTPALWPMN
ncbi:hypothetical protein [Vibrio metoecus]|uniref:hypothetical protein n=1 Tax=Vibrio metoecus TaxID=1481663 RepID=UPI000A5A2AF2